MIKAEIERIINDLPYGIKVSLIGGIEKTWDDTLGKRFDNPDLERNADNILELCGLNIGPMTAGMDRKEEIRFKHLVTFLLTEATDFTIASLFVVLIKRYMVPMAERKQALEKMIIALGKETEDDGHTQQAD